MRFRRPRPTLLHNYVDAIQLHHAPTTRQTLRVAALIRGIGPSVPVRHISSTRISFQPSPSKSSVPRRPPKPDRTFEKARLEQPVKDARPSHPSSSGDARARRSKIYVYGGELPPAAKAVQAKRRYPNMFPTEGTFLHWFLSSRMVHLVLSLSVLTICAGTISVREFRRTTPYLELLPSWEHFFRHPLDATRQVWHVFGQHVAWNTEQTQLAREKNVEDARKRKAYRVAHGLERPEDGLQGVVPGVDVAFGEKASGGDAAVLSERDRRNLEEDAEFERKVKAAFRDSVIKAGGSPDIVETHREMQGKPKELKKWFGIW